MVCKNIEISKKSTKVYELKFTNNGSVEDITGWTVYFTAKANKTDSDANAKISKKITTHTDAVSGKTQITLDTDDTNIDVGNYYYAIDYKDDEDQVGTLLEGRLTIFKPVRDTKD